MNRAICLTPILCLMCDASAFAHGLGGEVRYRTGHLWIWAYYHDNSPVGHARIQIQSSEGLEVTSGSTDDNGLWRGNLPRPGRFLAIIADGAGHRTEIPFRVPESLLLEHQLLSDAASRDEFTAVPWFKIILGVLVLGICGVIASKMLSKRIHS